MTLMTAHRILIGSAVVFFAFFACWMAWHSQGGSDQGALWWSLGSGLTSVGLAVYLAGVWNRE